MLRKISGGEKVYGKQGGRVEYRNFPSKKFCLKVPKHFVGETFSLSLVSGIDKFMLQRVMSRYSVEKKQLSHSKEAFRRGTLPSCVAEISGSEKVYG